MFRLIIRETNIEFAITHSCAYVIGHNERVFAMHLTSEITYCFAHIKDACLSGKRSLM